MKQPKPRPSFLMNFGLLAGVIMIWAAFAPAKLGGQVSYVMVNGISMEPHYHTGDLVVVRKVQDYQIGDVVTYRDAKMGAYVIHRIIGMEQGQFLIQGDNNSWVDAYHPTHNEIIGKQWFYVPKAGRVMQWFRAPINLSLTIVLLGGVFMSSTITKPTKGQKGGNHSPIHSGGYLEGTFYLLGILCVGFFGLSIFTFTRPLTRSAENIPYQQEGIYSYSATATPGVYDGGMVQSGEPIFPKLTCFLNLGFSYNLSGSQLQGVSGSYQMIARVADEQSGWQRTIPLVSQTAFNGSTYSAAAPLDLCQLTTMMNMVESETGLRTNTYLVEIITNVAFTADASGQIIADTFSPTLAFKFDKVHLYLSNTNAEIDPMHLTKQGLAASNALQTNTFSIFGLTPKVQTMRLAALFGFSFSLMGLCIMGLSLYRTTQQSQDALIRLKYGGMLMDVYEQSLSTTSSTVNVTSIDNLAKLAERQGTMILHMIQNDLHIYLVQGNGTTYRYAVNSKGKFETDSIENEITKPVAARFETASITPKSEPEFTVNVPLPNRVHKNIPVRRTVIVEEKKPVKTDSQAAWEKIQREAQGYLESHAKNKTAGADRSDRQTMEYSIQTGEIGFYETETAKTVILNKIKI